MKATEARLDAAIAAIRPGGRLSDIGHAIESVAEPAGFGIVREYGGHGIGRALHEDPFIQNWGPAGRGPDLRPGPGDRGRADAHARRRGDAACSPTAGPSSRPTGRSSAHFEHTIAVTEDGPEVLTARRSSRFLRDASR